MLCDRVACLVVNPITINNFGVLFNCTPAGRASGFMNTPAKKLSIQLVASRFSVLGRAHWGSAVGFLLLQRFSKGLAVEESSCFNSALLDLDLYVCCFDPQLN